MKQSIKVSVRIRPDEDDADGCLLQQNGKLVVYDGSNPTSFNFPNKVVTGSDQVQAFDELASDLLEKLFEGYSCTLLAYGQTGSGKTYTMFGPPGCLTETALSRAATSASYEEKDNIEENKGYDDDEMKATHVSHTNIPLEWGIFPRIAMHLLSIPGCTLHASAVEVYQDLVYDLLNNSTQIAIATGNKKSATPIVRVTGGSVNGVKKDANGVHLPSCTCGKCRKAKEEAWKARTQAIRDKQEQSRIDRCNSRQRRRRGEQKDSSETVHNSKYTKFDQTVSSSSGNNDNIFATVGETMLPLTDGRAVAQLARTVELSRVAHGHLLNSRSSRSHCIVRIFIKQRGSNDKGRGGTRRQQFCFVDLAGSERIHKSGVSGKRQAEAMEINQSLSVLGRVIMKLTEREKNGNVGNGGGGPHIPFRDSVLTMLLQSSFDGSGNSCTSVIINASADARHSKETLSSLRFGAGMSRVNPRVSINATQSGGDDEQRIASMKATLAMKKKKLNDFAEAGHGGRFGAGAVSSEKKTFEENLVTLKRISGVKNSIKVQLAEARSANSRSSRVRDLESQLKNLSWQETNIGDVLLRQKTIPGFWIPPSALYKALEAEVALLEGQLRTM